MWKRWYALLPALGLAALATCNNGGSVTLEELPNRYWGAMASEDWRRVWELFSPRVQGICDYETFETSREAFKEQSSDQFDHYQRLARGFAEGEWEAEVDGDGAMLFLQGDTLRMDATRQEDGGWRVSDSGEFQSCLPFLP